MERRRRIAKGFTLIELCIVLALIAVLAAVGIPRYAASVARYRADAAARRIVADLTNAQAHARNNCTSATITFDTTAQQYQIVGMTDASNGGATYNVSLKNDPYNAMLTSVSLGSPAGASLTFNGFGVPSNGGGTIVVSTGAVQKTITIDADSGAATIQ